MAAPSSSFMDRPTLPSLRSLDLPMPGSKIILPSINELYPGYDHHVATTSTTKHLWQGRQRQASISSTCTSSSRTSSMSPPPSASTGRTSLSPSPPPASRHAVRIVLANSFEDADAALLFPAPGITHVSNIPTIVSSPGALDGVQPGAPLLLVGSALERFHASGRRVAKGARVHPYRLESRPSSSRRPSMVAP